MTFEELCSGLNKSKIAIVLETTENFMEILNMLAEAGYEASFAGSPTPLVPYTKTKLEDCIYSYMVKSRYGTNLLTFSCSETNEYGEPYTVVHVSDVIRPDAIGVTAELETILGGVCV